MKKLFRGLGRMSLRGRIALFICLVFLVMALFAPWLSPYEPDKISGAKFEAPSAVHLLGTDDLGMDIFSQLCAGARISLTVGVSAALCAALVGGAAGLAAAFFSRRADRLIMSVCNIFQSVPDVPLIIILSAFFGRRLWVLTVTIALFSWTNTARIIRSRSLALKELGYVRLSASYGASFFHIFREHLFWEIWPLWLISFAQLVGRAVVMEASMAFLGLGDPTSKSWGMILNKALSYRGIYYTDYWKWWITPPVLAIALLVTSLSVLVAELERAEGLGGMKGAG